ncbi:MAG: GxxExxY protein [Phycisphaerales bacterium]
MAKAGQGIQERRGLDCSTGDQDPLSGAVIGAAIEVHKALGPGLLESTYQACLAAELKHLGIPFQEQVDVPIRYRGVKLESGYRLDFVVAGSLVVELKSVDRLLPIHEAQLLTYLRLTSIRTGLLLNFNTAYLRGGIKRLVL